MFVMWDGLSILHDIDDTDIQLPGLGRKYRLLMNNDFNLTLWDAVGFSADDNALYLTFCPKTLLKAVLYGCFYDTF